MDKKYMELVKEVSECIQLPADVREKVDLALKCIDPQIVSPLVRGLTQTQWEQCRRQLKNILEPDADGIKMLACMLWAAAISREKYKEMGISESIFSDTMKCFTRFVGEHRESYGQIGFDRDFWTGRQLSLQLFRLGELEFEKCIFHGEPVISIHIPSDADFSREQCCASIKNAVCFFDSQYRKYGNLCGAPDFSKVPYICESWLLSPALKTLLPPHSKIIRFQEMFDICSVNEEDMSFVEWVYKRRDLPFDQLPENTSLQKNMKTYLLSGGRVGEACGRLKNYYLV